jgi:hypothetical protein
MNYGLCRLYVKAWPNFADPAYMVITGSAHLIYLGPHIESRIYGYAKILGGLRSRYSFPVNLKSINKDFILVSITRDCQKLGFLWIQLEFIVSHPLIYFLDPVSEV